MEKVRKVWIITINEKEWIPVGCVPTTAVAATRCQYRGGGVSVQKGCLCPESVLNVKNKVVEISPGGRLRVQKVR